MEFLTSFLKEIKEALKLEIFPLSRDKKNLDKFIIYELSNEELNLSIDNKILHKDLELNLSLYTKTYKDLRELKNALESFLLEFHKKPIEFLMDGESKDLESGFFKSEIWLTYRL